MNASASVEGGNKTLKNKSYEHEERWMLHGNISQKGYGNALIGRYGGCFEERYRETYDDRAYHAKGLDAPARWTQTLGMRRGQCGLPKRLENMRRWKCQLS